MNTDKTESLNTAESGNLAKPMLCNVLDNLGFIKFLASKNWWVRKVYNESGCEFSIYVRLLNDNETIRVSVLEKDTDEMEAVDLFETKRYLHLSNFLNVVG
jgi:hypothetical protein